MLALLKRLPLLVLFCLIASVGLHAQDNAALTGTVTDTTGAVMPEAIVVLTNPSRGLKFTQKTNKEGSYRFPDVPPAQSYKINVTHDGFVGEDINEITLAVGITQTQNATLRAGSAQTEEVTAKNELVTINTTDASIGNNFDVELINDLPVQNRNSPAALFTLQPGVTSQGAVTGARTDQTSVTVDGMDVNDISTGQFGNVNGGLPVDATQEFRGTVAGLPSNLGTGSGGQFQLVTKSGTNKFHGDLNEYHRDTVTASNLWFNNNAVPQVARTPLIRNQFGGAIGGPILRDKLFLFLDFNNSRIVSAIQGTDTVPLDSYRAGNVGYVNNSNSNNGAACTSTSRQNTTPGCISFRTPAQIAALDPAGIGENMTLFGNDSTTGLFSTRYPHANDLTLGDGVNTGGFRFTQSTLNVLYNGVGRADYNLTSKQRVFVQYHDSHQDSVQSINRFAGDPLTRPFSDRSYGYVGSHIWQIGNNKVNQFYYGDNVTVFSFALAYNPNGSTILSSFSGLITTPYDGGNIQRRRVPIPEVRDDFNWTLGAHNISIGGDFKFIKASNFLGSDYNSYTIGLGGNVTTLNPSLRPADILATQTTTTTEWDNAFALSLGRVGRISSIYNFNAAGQQTPQNTGATRRYRYYQTEAYAGDTWKVTKNLTLTYGLRYSYYSVPFETLGAEAVPNLTFNQYFAARVKQTAAGVSGVNSVGANAVPLVTYTLGGQVNNAPGYYAPNPYDFAPRFAIVYNPASLPHTVFNASSDLVYDRTVANAVNFIQNQATFIFQNSVAQPYGNSANVAGSLATDPRIGATLLSLPAPPTTAAPVSPYLPYVNAAGQPTGLALGTGTTIIDANLKDPYSITMNAGVQQEFGHGLILRANYAGRLGRRLLGQADASQLIDFPDTTSGQLLSQAFAYATLATRQGSKPTQLTPQPFFEHVLTPNYYVGRSCGTLNGAAVTCNSNTAFVAYNQATYVNLGDITDALYAFASTGFLPTNAGLASQFARNTFYTNKGSSNYNGLLLTLSKNLQNGTKFDLNYTYSKSIDNASLIANAIASGSGFICDVTRPRACRGPSDFDVTHILTADFIAQLPVGRGRRFASSVPWYVNELIGGWDLSGIPTYQSGFAYNATSTAYLASFANNDPAIYDNSRSGDTNIKKGRNAANQLIAYKSTAAALSHFRGPIGIEYGSRNNLRGPSQFYFDAGLSKIFQVLPDNRLNLKFRADAFNVLNHPTFGIPTAAITSANFGVISTQTGATGIRVGQFSLRLEF